MSSTALHPQTWNTSSCSNSIPLTSQPIVQYCGLGAPISQVRDDMTATLVEPCRTKFSDQSTPMTNGMSESQAKQGVHLSCASCKCRRPSCTRPDPTDGVEPDLHKRCVVNAKGLQFCFCPSQMSHCTCRSSKATSSCALSRGQTFEVDYPSCRGAYWAGCWPLRMAQEKKA